MALDSGVIKKDAPKKTQDTRAKPSQWRDFQHSKMGEENSGVNHADDEET